MATTFGVTPTGFVIKRLSDIQASLKASLQTVTDANGNTISIDLEDSSLISQFAQIVAEEISEAWSMAGALANQFDPNYNIGPFQSGTVQLNGITRLAGIPTEIAIQVGGVGGTVIPVGASLTYNGSAFGVNSPITIENAPVATGTVTIASTPADGDTIQIGSITYTFRTTTMTAPFSVRREPVGAVTAAGCASALVAAIGLSGTAGTDYGTGTYLSPDVTAVVDGTTNTQIDLTAVATGTNGNFVALVSGQASISVPAATLAGGLQYGSATGNATATSSVTPVVVPAGSPLSIAGPINGWISAVSVGVPLVAGTAEESDEALRIRQQISTQVTAARESSAILSAVQNVAGVVYANLYENPALTGLVMTGGYTIPAGSITVLTNGGVNTDIANAIYSKMSCMTQTSGAGLPTAVAVVVGTNTINFATISGQAVTVNVNILPTGVALPLNIATTIQAAVVAWGNVYYTPNQNVYASDIYKALVGISGVYTTSLSIGTAATGTITFSGVPATTGTVTIGNVTYRLMTVMAQANDVQLGTQAATMASLMKAINGTGVVGVDYYAGTTKNLLAGVSSSDTTHLYLTARMAGTDGNLIQLSKTATNTAVSGTVLSGGATTVDGQSEVINFGFQANFTTVNVIVNNI